MKAALSSASPAAGHSRWKTTQKDSLAAEREHLANLLEALQRCAHFLHATSAKVPWSLEGNSLRRRQKDVDLFEALAALNERFSKLQDTMGAAMRHAALLMSEATTPFLKVLVLFEKVAVIDSVEGWQLCRTARNLAAHDYETDYALIAEYFNELQALLPWLVKAAARLLAVCEQTLNIRPASQDFEAEFRAVAAAHGA